MPRERLPGEPLDAAHPDRDTVLARIAARQHGAVTTGQLKRIGFSRGAVRKRVALSRLHPVYRGVYAVGHERLSEQGRWMAGVLVAGDGAALSHLSAAVLWRVWRYRASGIDVIAPRRVMNRDSLRIHEYRRADHRDITTCNGIPVTTIPRTLIDLSEVLDQHQLANVIHEAAFRNRLNLVAVRGAIKRAHGRHRLRVLEAALAAHQQGSAGTRSRAEDRFVALIDEHDLPAPLVNVPVQTSGKRVEVDLYWPQLRLCVEVDGPGHTRPRTRRADRARDASLRQAGFQVLRFSASDADSRPQWVIGRLLAAFAA